MRERSRDPPSVRPALQTCVLARDIAWLRWWKSLSSIPIIERFPQRRSKGGEGFKIAIVSIVAIEKSAESSVPQPSLSKRAGDLPTTRTRTGLSDEVWGHSMSDSIPEKRTFTAYSLCMGVDINDYWFNCSRSRSDNNRSEERAYDECPVSEGLKVFD